MSYTHDLGYSSSFNRHHTAQQRPHTYQQGPPSGVDPQLWQWFCAVDTDRSGALSVTELQDALVNGESDWDLTDSGRAIIMYFRKFVK
jgi:hypothetical protein